jgi:DNA repair photolyase
MLFPVDDPPLTSPLIGIARMAAESGVLEGKRRVEYRDLASKSYITRCPNPQLPFQWTVNPYRGCEFGCKYCYARYTHEFMELRDGSLFETRIFAKQFQALSFRSELRRLPLGETIAIGTATDPYQPAERRYRITRQMLEVLAREPGFRVWVTTKSDLVRRDIDLLQRIAEHTPVHVNMTVTTMDAELARLTEPFAPRPELRIAAVKQLREAGIRAGVSLSPILPLINDSEASIHAVFEAARECGALWVWHNVLFLKSCARAVFFPFLEERFPHLVRRYRERFQNTAFISGPYLEMVNERVEKARAAHGLGRAETRHELEAVKTRQLRLDWEAGTGTA